MTTLTNYAQKDREGYYEVNDVIRWFLSKDSMSPKKLQKLLYYAYAWTLTLNNEDEENLENKLFEDKFEAWVHGPVIPEVYRDFKSYGHQDIPQITNEEPPVFDEDVEDILEQVWEVYGGFSGNELESLTHQEDPWKNARKGYRPLDRCNEVISDKDIFRCYGERL